MEGLVEPDVVQERRRRAVRALGEEDGRPGDAGNAPRGEAAVDLVEGDDVLPGRLGGEELPPLPGRERDEDAAADQEREPAAVRDLEEVRAEEGEVDDEEEPGDGGRPPARLHRHRSRATRWKRSVVMIIVPVTAMP